MSNLDAWKKLAITEVTLPSGTVIGLALPNIVECIVAGDIPMPILNSINEEEGEPATPEQTQVMMRYRREMIRAAVREVGGEAVTLTLEDVSSLPEDDADAIYEYATRSKPLPNSPE